MNIIKINNLFQLDGQADYKGLEIEKIVSGTQLYPNYENAAYFLYDGEVVESSEVQIVTKETYEEHKARVIYEQSLIVTPEKRIEILEQTLAEILGV